MADPTDPRTMPGYDAAANSVSTATKTMQSFAGEFQRMSKDQIEQTTQLMDKLRSAKTVEDVVSIQSGFLQQSFANYAEATRKFGEMMMSMPMEMMRQGQSAMQQGASAMTKTAEQAGEQIQRAGEQFEQHRG